MEYCDLSIVLTMDITAHRCHHFIHDGRHSSESAYIVWFEIMVIIANNEDRGDGNLCGTRRLSSRWRLDGGKMGRSIHRTSLMNVC